jgi:hypothetical protein
MAIRLQYGSPGAMIVGGLAAGTSRSRREDEKERRRLGYMQFEREQYRRGRLQEQQIDLQNRLEVQQVGFGQQKEMLGLEQAGRQELADNRLGFEREQHDANQAGMNERQRLGFAQDKEILGAAKQEQYNMLEAQIYADDDAITAGTAILTPAEIAIRQRAAGRLAQTKQEQRWTPEQRLDAQMMIAREIAAMKPRPARMVTAQQRFNQGLVTTPEGDRFFVDQDGRPQAMPSQQKEAKPGAEDISNPAKFQGVYDKAEKALNATRKAAVAGQKDANDNPKSFEPASQKDVMDRLHDMGYPIGGSGSSVVQPSQGQPEQGGAGPAQPQQQPTSTPQYRWDGKQWVKI